MLLVELRNFMIQLSHMATFGYSKITLTEIMITIINNCYSFV